MQQSEYPLQVNTHELHKNSSNEIQISSLIVILPSCLLQPNQPQSHILKSSKLKYKKIINPTKPRGGLVCMLSFSYSHIHLI